MSIESHLKSRALQPKFRLTEEVQCHDKMSIAFDHENRLIRLRSQSGSSSQMDFYMDGGDVRTWAVEVDAKTKSSTSTSSMLGRAVVGSMFGGVGAIIGAATAQKTQVTEVKKVELRFDVPYSSLPARAVLYRHGAWSNQFKADSAQQVAQRIVDTAMEFRGFYFALPLAAREVAVPNYNLDRSLPPPEPEAAGPKFKEIPHVSADYTPQFEQLAKLREQGVISEEQYRKATSMLKP